MFASNLWARQFISRESSIQRSPSTSYDLPGGNNRARRYEAGVFTEKALFVNVANSGSGRCGIKEISLKLYLLQRISRVNGSAERQRKMIIHMQHLTMNRSCLRKGALKREWLAYQMKAHNDVRLRTRRSGTISEQESSSKNLQDFQWMVSKERLEMK